MAHGTAVHPVSAGRDTTFGKGRTPDEGNSTSEQPHPLVCQLASSSGRDRVDQVGEGNKQEWEFMCTKNATLADQHTSLE